MKSLVLTSLVFFAFIAQAAPDRHATVAECSGPIFADHNSINDRGTVEISLHDNVVTVTANTAISLKNFKREFYVFDGKKGWIDPDQRLRNAHIYAENGKHVLSLTSFGYDSISKKLGTNTNFETENDTYYGTLDCTVAN